MKLSKSEQRKKDEDLLDQLMIRVRNRSTPISHREVGQVLLKKRVVAHIQIVSRRMHQMVQILEESAKYDSVAKAKFLFVLSYPFECDRDIKEEIMNAGDVTFNRRNQIIKFVSLNGTISFEGTPKKGKARGQNQMARSRKLRTARNAAQRRRKIDGRVKNRLPPKVRRGRINDDTQESDTGDEDVEMDARTPSVSIGAVNRGRESDNDSDVDANQMGLDGEKQSVPHARNGENSDSNHSEPSDNVNALDFDDYEMESEWENRERSVSPIRNDAGQRRAEELDEDDEIRLDQSVEQRNSRKWHLELNALLYSITDWLQNLEPENDWFVELNRLAHDSWDNRQRELKYLTEMELLKVFRFHLHCTTFGAREGENFVPRKDFLRVFRSQKIEKIPNIGPQVWQIVAEELNRVPEDHKISIDAIDMFVQHFSADLCYGIEGIYD